MGSINPFNLIMRYESRGGQNIPNFRFDSGHTAQGYFQITNSTWRSVAPQVGIDLNQYPSAMKAPFGVQQLAAAGLYQNRGLQDWTCDGCNMKIRGIVNEQGMGAFMSKDEAMAYARAHVNDTAPNVNSPGGASGFDPAMGGGPGKGSMGDPAQPYSGEGGQLPNSSPNFKTTAMDDLYKSGTITPSPTVPRAIDQQTKVMSETEKKTEEARAKAEAKRQKELTTKQDTWFDI